MKNVIILIAVISFLITAYGKIQGSSDIQITFGNSGITRRGQNDRVRSRVQTAPTIAVAKNKAIVLDWQEKTANKIRATFVEDPETAVATFRAESGLRETAQGWNCYYGGISLPCESGDRDQAWSVDCGVAQLNFPGSVCPAESFNEDWNIQKAYEWKYLPNKKAGGTGFGPWVANTTGRHLVFLTK